MSPLMAWTYRIAVPLLSLALLWQTAELRTLSKAGAAMLASMQQLERADAHLQRAAANLRASCAQ